MRIGNGNKAAGKKDDDIRASRLRFARGRIIVVLEDGREISSPLKWYPTLQRASANQRTRWIKLGEGEGFHWPDLDLDLSAFGLANGLRETIPRPPDISELAPVRVARRRSA